MDNPILIHKLSFKSGGKNSLNHSLYFSDNIIFLKYLIRTNKKYDVIYIDPPYGTGKNDKNYKDDYKKDEWLEHIEKRLKLAHEILNDDGFIAISIGKERLAELIIICHKIYSKKNFEALIPRKTTPCGQKTKHIMNNQDFILIYSKKHNSIEFTRRKKTGKYKNSDEIGNFNYQKFDTNSFTYNSKKDYQIHFNNKIFYAGNVTKKEWKIRKNSNMESKYAWQYKKKWLLKAIKEKRIIEKNGKIQYKSYENYDKDFKKRILYKPLTVWDITEKGTSQKYTNQYATKNLKTMFYSNVTHFKFPKPVALIKWIIKLHPNKNSKILDFYSGSGTTMHSCLELNRNDKGKRICSLCIWKEDNNLHMECYDRLFNIINGKTKNNKVINWTKKNVPFLNNSLNVFQF